MPALLLPLLPILQTLASQFITGLVIGFVLKWTAILVGILVVSYTLYNNW